MPKKEMIDLALTVEKMTEKAWLLTDGVTTEWVPKSQAEDNEDGTFTLAMWIAKEKGFV